jgi:hypothetical protein
MGERGLFIEGVADAAETAAFVLFQPSAVGQEIARNGPVEIGPPTRAPALQIQSGQLAGINCTHSYGGESFDFRDERSASATLERERERERVSEPGMLGRG